MSTLDPVIVLSLACNIQAATVMVDVCSDPWVDSTRWRTCNCLVYRDAKAIYFQQNRCRTIELLLSPLLWLSFAGSKSYYSTRCNSERLCLQKVARGCVNCQQPFTALGSKHWRRLFMFCNLFTQAVTHTPDFLHVLPNRLSSLSSPCFFHLLW